MGCDPNVGWGCIGSKSHLTHITLTVQSPKEILLILFSERGEGEGMGMGELVL